jgi:chromate transporter
MADTFESNSTMHRTADESRDGSMTPVPLRPQVTASALVRLALYYGVAGFGGGYSVLSQLRRDLVEKKRWIEADEFLVFAEISKSLPGTPATSLLTLLGQRVGGLRGGLLAAVAFLVPSMILMIGCGAAYSWMRSATSLAIFFDGMNAAMVGVVAATTLDLARSALRGRWDIAAAAACAALLATRLVSEPILALAAIAIGIFRGSSNMKKSKPSTDSPPKSERLHGVNVLVYLLIGSGVGVLAALVRVFVPIGIMTFGGGLAMIPSIEHTVVLQEHWLDRTTFADAVALGQITPGPVAICATFIGYRVGGITGALVATAAMFGPAIALALVVGRSVDRFRRSPLVEGALRTLAPAVIGMLGAATFSLGRAAFLGWLSVVVGVASFAVLQRGRVSPLWTLVAGGLVALVAARVGH